MIRRSGLISMLALTSYLFCGFSQPNSCNNKGSGIAPVVAIASVAIAAAVIIPVVIVHNHHNLKGCVTTGGSGLEVVQDDAKAFTLVSPPADLKVGDSVHLHGAKIKAKKGSKDGPTFVVDKVTRDYGPCKVPATAAAASAATPEPSLSTHASTSALMR
jgi:hypothetical protein